MFSFARAIYDEFDAHFNGNGDAVSLTVSSYTFFAATVSHNYSDIGTNEVDAYINTRHAQVDAIQTINSDELAALVWFQPHQTAIAVHSWHQVYRRDTLSTIFTKKRCSKISFDGCSD